jgi:hypothetical protein
MSTIPSPAATKWVPVGPGPMPDFRYRGDWAAGNYTDGDIVVYNGVTYLCVAPTTDSPTPWAPPTTSPSYGTSLPASPADGMEHILVDSISNPTYQLRFRYNAGHTGDAYKWEFVGGAKILSQPGGSNPLALGSSWQGLPGTPTVFFPRTGRYQAGFACIASCVPGAFISSVQIYNQTTGPVGDSADFADGTMANTRNYQLFSESIITANQGQQLILAAINAAGVPNTFNFSARSLWILPVRVS